MLMRWPGVLVIFFFDAKKVVQRIKITGPAYVKFIMHILHPRVIYEIVWKILTYMTDFVDRLLHFA